MKKILIIGATSAIAEACARLFAARGDALYLVGRRADALNAIAADLRVRGAGQVEVSVQDANALDAHAALLQHAALSLNGLDMALIAHGSLPDQQACEQSAPLTLAEFRTNALSQISLCTYLAQRFEAQRSGTLAVISSVAGDRGRQSNYVYGAAKAALSAFVSGLGQRLAKQGVAVVNIKPGFVDTPMTAAFKKGPLWARPEQVAKAIVRGMDRGSPVVYTPWFWWGIMQIIRNVPERLFRRLSL